ncbi:flavodoxin [Hartmannibacter diazotrophicus]|uniref:Flavodoxin n=1 Tax=Hartmannibacter diazotrophicus TaxID=1482074 RepID=A0A2C9D831_9HYPH|nr:flavodoxin [Hartmannibacter diazotrophicus]SON56339.1 flavodoxin [Hartmannibacter diazotrophicus]
MADVLVVYFSRTGNTRKVALAVAESCAAEIEEIREPGERNGLWGWFRSGREAWQRKLAEIEPAEKNPADYGLVIMGTPVWAGTMSSPMRAYLAHYGTRLKRVALFCTLGGAGADKAMADMAAMCSSTPAAKLAILEAELKSGAYRYKAAAFGARLGVG